MNLGNARSRPRSCPPARPAGPSTRRRAEVVGVQPGAGRRLVELHQLLALLVAPQRRGERADIQRVAGHVQQVVQDAGDLGEHRPDPLRPLRRRDAEQLLRAEREGVLHAHGRHVVEPVEIRHRLHVGLVLDQLLGAAMQQADMRVGTLHHLAVHLQDQAQHAVRGRVLRAEIDRVAVDLDRLGRFGPSGSIVSGHSRRSVRPRHGGRGVDRRAHAGLPRRPALAAGCRRAVRLLVARQRDHALPGRDEIEVAEILRQADGDVDHALLLLVVADLDEAGQREILAQRMPVEAVIGHDAAQIGLAAEQDAEQVPSLPLPPGGTGPDRRGRTARASSRRSARSRGRGGSARPTAGCRRRRSASAARASPRRKDPSAARTRTPGRHATRSARRSGCRGGVDHHLARSTAARDTPGSRATRMRQRLAAG